MAQQDVNLVKMAGALAKDPLVFDEDKDKMPFAQLQLKIVEGGLMGNEPVETYHLCKAFGQPMANKLKRVYTGTRMAFYGRLRTRSYEANGVTRYVTEVVIDPGNFKITQAVTEPTDPMADFDAKASESAAKEGQIEHWANQENRAYAEHDQSDEHIPEHIEDESSDNIPF